MAVKDEQVRHVMRLTCFPGPGRRVAVRGCDERRRGGRSTGSGTSTRTGAQGLGAPPLRQWTRTEGDGEPLKLPRVEGAAVEAVGLDRLFPQPCRVLLGPRLP